MTFSGKMEIAEGRPSGFDLMRILLAFAVVAQHSMNTTLGMERTLQLLTTPLRAPIALILAMFFVLSGFLVGGSLFRSKSLISFLGLRVMRLAPALVVEVIIAACLLGPILTQYSLTEYFTDLKFFRYFLNILGDIQYKLPGLFLSNPLPEIVNQQLWTVPYELKCYLSLALLATIGIAFHRAAFASVLVLIQLSLAVYVVMYQPEQTPVLRGSLLVFCFLVGISFYAWRDAIAYSLPLAIGSALLSFVLLLVPYGDFFVVVPAAYLTCYLGLADPKKPTLLASGDYSYGVFLYGFPIQQAVAAVGGPTVQCWWLNLIISAPIALLVAFASWHFVEKHTLKFRDALFRVERSLLSQFSFLRFWAARSVAQPA